MTWSDLLHRCTPLILINPTLTLSTSTDVKPEGCLSLPQLVGNVRRSTTVDVEFIDLNNEVRSLRLTGFESKAVQHEVDHLDGRLFIDHIGEEGVEQNLVTVKRYRELKMAMM